MLDAAGELHLLMKKDLRAVTFSKKSLMPSDYKTRLNAAELEDLLAFLSRQAGRPANRDKNSMAMDSGNVASLGSIRSRRLGLTRR